MQTLWLVLRTMYLRSTLPLLQVLELHILLLVELVVVLLLLQQTMSLALGVLLLLLLQLLLSRMMQLAQVLEL